MYGAEDARLTRVVKADKHHMVTYVDLTVGQSTVFLPRDPDDPQLVPH